MAPPPGTLRVGRYFLALLALMAVLYALVFLPGERHTPKLGLDLVGGQQVIFQARAPHGQAPTTSQMEQAKQIMEERVNGTGVTEATVVIQGTDQIVVSIPGGTGTDLSKLGQAAVLNFRGVVAPAVQVTCGKYASKSATTPTPSVSESNAPKGSSTSGATSKPSGSTTKSASTAAKSSGASQAPQDAGAHAITAPSSSPSAPATSGAARSSAAGSAKPSSGSSTAPASGSGSASSSAPSKCYDDPMGALKKADPKLTIPLTDTAYGKLTSTQQQEIQGALSSFNCDAGQTENDVRDSYYVACGNQLDGTNQEYAFLLGPVIVPGDQIDTATAQAANVAQGQAYPTVSLTLKSSGSSAWAKYTAAHNIGTTSPSTTASVTNCGASTYACANYVAFTLDGSVVSAPVNESAINGQATQISGNFTESSADTLAQQLQYGALPLSFQSQQAQSVSATLGSSQLKAGLLAGGIGLALVIIYSLIYYRALGLVTIASLVVSGGLTYSSLVVLGKQIGFTLSLAGIAGFIVAVGITADSFVVFFERIKDEVHDGRSLRVAVPRAWVRARRTILSADTVSFLAAAILYYFAAGDVKGFAFTLGLSTILDLIVVFLFTHPMVSLLSRSSAFGSARFTGLNAVRAGGIVTGETAPARPAKRAARGGSQGARRQTQAEAARPGAAVLDRDADPWADDRSQDPGSALDEAVDETPGADTDEASSDYDASQDAGSAQSGERRRTTPQGGSAAERAAARRARLREQRGGSSGGSGGDRGSSGDTGDGRRDGR